MPRQSSHVCPSYHVLSSRLLQPQKTTTMTWTDQRSMEHSYMITTVIRNTAKDTLVASGQTLLLKLLYMCIVSFSDLFLISELYLHPPRQLIDTARSPKYI